MYVYYTYDMCIYIYIYVILSLYVGSARPSATWPRAPGAPRRAGRCAASPGRGTRPANCNNNNNNDNNNNDNDDDKDDNTSNNNNHNKYSIHSCNAYVCIYIYIYMYIYIYIHIHTFIAGAERLRYIGSARCAADGLSLPGLKLFEALRAVQSTRQRCIT